MSSLKALRLRGVRAFHPDPKHKDHCEMKFEGPVTLISGENGAGKTTIIESLKYATMGQLRTSQPREFVTDPHIWGKKSVTAAVELDFTAVDGRDITVSRGAKVECSEKRKVGISYTATDCRIDIEEQDGTRTSTNIKQGEVNTEIPNLLGVSGAILENVIFCHQEDSCWPIDSNTKQLKERFDLIFGAEKYDKATKALKEVLKGLKTKKQEFEKEVAVQNERLETRLRFDKDIRSCRNEEKRLIKEREEMQALVADINAQVQEYDTMKAQIDEIRREIAIKEQLANAQYEYLKRLEESIGTVHKSRNECEEELRKSTNEVSAMEEMVMLDDQNSEKWEKQGDKLRDEVRSLVKEQAKRKLEADNAGVQREIYSNNLERFQQEFNTDDYVTMREELQNSVRSLEDQYRTTQQERRQKEEEMNCMVANAKKEVTEITIEHSALEKEKISEEQKINSLHEFTRELVTSTEESVRLTKQEIEELENGDRSEQCIDNEITLVGEQYNQQKEYVYQLKSKKKEVDEQASMQQEYSHLEAVIARKTSERNEHWEKVQTVLGEDIEIDTIEHVYASKRESLETSLKELRERMNQIEKELGIVISSLEREIAGVEEREVQNKKAKKKFEYILYDSDFQKVFDMKNKRLQECSEELAQLSNSHISSIYETFKKTAERDHKCPLCERPFHMESETRNFCDSMDVYVKGLPSKIQERKEEKEQYQKEVDTLNRIRPHYDLFVRNTELNELAKGKVNELEQRKEELNRVKTETTDALEEIENQYSSIMAISVAVQLLMTSIQDIADTERRKERISGLIDHTLPSITEITEELNRADDKANSLLEMKQKLSEELTEFRRRSSEMHQKLATEQRRESEVKEKFLEKMQRKARLDEITEEIQKKENMRYRKERELAELEDNQITMRKQFGDQEAVIKTQKDAAMEKKNLCELLCKNIEEARICLESIDSGEITEILARIESEIQAKDKQIKNLQDRIEKTRHDKKQHSVALEMARNNTNRWTKQLEWATHNEEYLIKIEERDAAKRKLELIVSRTMGSIVEYEDLKEQQVARNNEYVAIKTRLHAKQQELEGLVKNWERYNKAPGEMTEAAINLKATMMSISDTERYIKALDEALLEYHSKKMEEINQTIQQLWQSIYRGNDIDSITIKAESGSSSNATYNYRVVMRRDGVELDMSNRCSAGQKMIASLIIRLALADTFATNCGIMALDEPTTNLDAFNVDNLSMAISNLVEKRNCPGSKPFQLIVITHSNYFVNMLMKGGRIDHFYQVRRDMDGLRHYSAIYRCDPSYLQLEGG